MFRKAAIAVSIVLLAFTTACGSHKSASATSASGGATGAPVSSSSVCPTKETKKFAKTLFVTDAALAGGAFKHWIYTPAKEGKFKKGAHGRIKSFIKAAAAGAFTLNRLNAVKKNAESDPLLCKATIGPITKFTSSIKNLVSGAKHGSVDPSQVTSANSDLGSFHSDAAKQGNAFTDNQNASIGG
jgi:hypothetical protein